MAFDSFDSLYGFDISGKTATFLDELSCLGLMGAIEGKAVYADDEAFNRTAMRAKFTELEIDHRLITFPDGHQTV